MGGEKINLKEVAEKLQNLVKTITYRSTNLKHKVYEENSGCTSWSNFLLLKSNNEEKMINAALGLTKRKMPYGLRSKDKDENRFLMETM